MEVKGNFSLAEIMACVVQLYMTDERFMMDEFPIINIEAFQYEAALKIYEKPSKWQIYRYNSTILHSHGTGPVAKESIQALLN